MKWLGFSRVEIACFKLLTSPFKLPKSLPYQLAIPSVMGRRLPAVGLRSGHRSSFGDSKRSRISNFTRHTSNFRIGPLPCPALRLHPCRCHLSNRGPCHGDRPCSPCLRRIPRGLASPSRCRPATSKTAARLGRLLRPVVAREGGRFLKSPAIGKGHGTCINPFRPGLYEKAHVFRLFRLLRLLRLADILLRRRNGGTKYDSYYA